MKIEVNTVFNIGDKVKVVCDGFNERYGTIVKCAYKHDTIRYLVALDDEEIVWIPEANLDFEYNI